MLQVNSSVQNTRQFFQSYHVLTSQLQRYSQYLSLECHSPKHGDAHRPGLLGHSAQNVLTSRRWPFLLQTLHLAWGLVHDGVGWRTDGKCLSVSRTTASTLSTCGSAPGNKNSAITSCSNCKIVLFPPDFWYKICEYSIARWSRWNANFLYHFMVLRAAEYGSSIWSCLSTAPILRL